MSGKKGGILLYMLGVITLLSIIVTEFLIEASTAMRYRSQIAGREDLEMIAYSALETSLAVLAEIKELDEDWYSPAQGWGNPMAYAKLPIPSGYAVKVTINDETRKLSIYQKNLDDFGNLLIEMGISYEQVVTLKNEIKKYLAQFQDKESSNKEKGASKEEKKEDANKLNPSKDKDKDTKDKEKNKEEKKEEKKVSRTLFSLYELKEIPLFEKTFFDSKGNPKSNFQTLKDNVSVFNTDKVNINTAPALVKRILLGTAGLGPAAEGKQFLKSMKDLGRSEDDTRFGFKANVFDIEIEVMRGPVKYHLSAIVEGKGGAKESKKPFKESEKGPGGAEKSTPEKTKKTSEKSVNGSSTEKSASENKSNFSFLALTEDDSLVN